jgi:outer membrane receptor protein involved in Fe transport
MRSRTSLPGINLGLNPITVAVAAALGISVSLPAAQAQDQIDRPASDGVVVVTASRRETQIQDAPFSVSAFSGDELERQRLTSLTEASRFVPGMTVVEQGARGADLMVFRGLNVGSMNASEFLDNSGGGTVATYVGEIPVYLDLEMVDVERVEFLPGPQGTLYGAGTLGGAVRYVPKAPDLENFSVGLHGDVYSMNHSDDPGYATDAVVNAPIIDGKLAFRGSFYHLDDPGFIDYPYLVREPGVSNPEPDFSNPADVAANLMRRNDVDTQTVDSARLALLYQPTNAIAATFNYYDQSSQAGGRSVNHHESFNTGRYESGHRFVEPEDRETRLFSAEIVVDLGFAELTSATGFSSYDQSGRRDQTDFYLDQEWGYETFPSFVSFTREAANEDTVNQELRLVSNGTGRTGWIAGLFYNDYSVDSTSREFMPGFPESGIPGDWGIPVPSSDVSYYQANSDTLKEQALYGEFSFAISEQLELTAGGRFFQYDTTQHARFDVPFFDYSESQDNVADDDGFLGKLGLSYAFNDSVTAYATLSEGYRIGGANSVPACPDPLPVAAACALPGEVLIKPDRTTNFEVGVHALVGSGNMRIDAAVYSIDWNDVQTLGTTENGSLAITVNGGSARSRGLELAVQAGGAGPWSVRSSYAYNQAELTSFAPGLVDGADAFSGDRLSGTPEHQVAFELRHRRQLSNGWNLDAGYSVTTTTDVLTRVGMRNGGESLGGYTIHSASLAVSRDQWQATLYADNLWDKFAETSVRLEPSSIRSVNGFDVRRYYRNVLRPRSVGLEFRYAIGR